MSTDLVSIVAELKKSEAIIRAATNKLDKQFGECTIAVGGELRVAQAKLATRKAGFYVWCKERFDWSKSQVHRMMDAAEVMRITSPIGEVAPANEGQCRELAKLPKEHVAEVWRQVVMVAEKTEKPITAARIKKHIEQQAEEAEAAEGGGGDEEKPKKPAKTDKPAESVSLDEIENRGTVTTVTDDEPDDVETSDLPAFTASIVLDALEQPIPPEYRNAHQLSITLMSVGRELDKYRKQAKELKEQPGGEWLNLQQIDEHVRALKGYFQDARYYTLCHRCDGKGGEECKTCNGIGFLPDYKKNQI